MKIISYGAAGQVTGSCHFIEIAGTKFLLDCGLFQGPTKVDLQNLSPLGFDPKEIDFVLLSHAHLDHCGRLPLLVKGGFMGPIYTTPATRDLAQLILADSASLQEKSETPLYTLEDVEKTMTLFSPLPHKEILRKGKLEISFHYAGHLLGASWIKIKTPDTCFAFSGDLGRYNSPFYHDPEPLGDDVELLLLETTNANKHVPSIQQGLEDLYAEIRQAYLEQRTVLLPAFSIGRTEEVISGLSKLAFLKKDDLFKKIPFYVDSSLAHAGLKVFHEHTDLHTMDPRDLQSDNLHFIATEQSYALDKSTEPKVLLSASGMMEGGHILHHAASYLPQASTLLLFVGYQGEETLGRRILEGEKSVLIGKSPVEVNAEIKEIKGLSGHADHEDLMGFLATASKLQRVILLHGEAQNMTVFEELLSENLRIRKAQHGIDVLENWNET